MMGEHEYDMDTSSFLTLYHMTNFSACANCKPLQTTK